MKSNYLRLLVRGDNTALNSRTLHIAVGSHEIDPDDGSILLSPECQTSDEVIAWANNLGAELDRIKAEVRKYRP